MKTYKYCLAILALAATVVSGCKNIDIDDEHHYDNKLYVSSTPVTDDLLIKDKVSTASRQISYRLAAPATKDIEISFDAVPSMTAAYNLVYHDNAEALAPEFYNIPVKTAKIKAGDISSDNITIEFKNTNMLNKKKRYVLPVKILSATNIDVLESANTAFFVFKGAALINVVANITKMYFPINWSSSVDVSNLSTVTVEALVKSPDWYDGRENALSTVFGIEGHFLVRIGDADRSRDQLQAAFPGGNFPGPNEVDGLPVNEWVHIALVYDVTTGERIYYKDGVKVYKDNAASEYINLKNPSNGNKCYIGKAWDDSRWLPGEISELRVWNVQRTADEIAGNPYEVDPESDGLIAYWKFNEGAGNTIHDHTGHGNDITAVGGEPTWIPVEIPAIH